MPAGSQATRQVPTSLEDAGVSGHPFSGSILGLEAYAQGGMGVEFLNFPTGATTTDKVSSNVMYMRLTGAASYQVSDKLTLGLSAIGGYAKMEFAMFPESPGGMDVTDLTDTGLAGRFGVQFKVCDRMTLGAVYTSEASLDRVKYSRHSVVSSMGSCGLGWFRAVWN